MRDIVSPLDGFASPFGALRGSAAFTPASLFANDETGIWLDPSDTSTLFQDTAGTTPVTALGQTVALALDKSQGAGYAGGSFTGLGPELVTNGTFDTDLTGWTLSNSPAWVSGRAELSRNGGIDVVRQSFATTIGAAYKVAADVTGTSGKLGIGVSALDDSILNAGALVNTSVDRLFVATTNPTWIYLITEVNGTSSWDNISVRELPGNHATQSGASFRPQYQTAGLLLDGLDDRKNTPYKPTTSGTIIAKFNGDTASRVIAGSQPASDGRCFLALDASGRLAAGIGAQSTATIYGGSDIRGEDHIGAVTWDGSTVKLYLDGTEVYSEAQSGAVNTTVDMMLGALSANGTAAAFWDNIIADHIILSRVMTPEEITKTTSLWSA